MNKYIKILLAASLVVFAANANAKTYYLTESNALADGINYVQVDVNESAGSLNFTIQSLFGGWGLDKFFFNLTSTSFPATISNLSSGWGTVTNSSPYQASEFGLFTNQEKAPGASSLTLFFTVTGPSALSLNNLVANAEGWIFAAHQKCGGRDSDCQGIGDISSHHVAGPSTVPLPAAAWLFGSALIGFMGWSNRRRV